MFGAGWKLPVLWGGCVGWRRGGWSAGIAGWASCFRLAPLECFQPFECCLWDKFRVPLARSWRLPICHAESLVAGVAIRVLTR
jgi:hypothetical protein